MTNLFKDNNRFLLSGHVSSPGPILWHGYPFTLTRKQGKNKGFSLHARIADCLTPAAMADLWPVFSGGMVFQHPQIPFLDFSSDNA